MPVQREKILTDLLEFISQNFMVDVSAGKIDLDVSLVLSGMVDSTGLMELIVFIEKKWKIKVLPEEMTQANLGSIRKMTKFVSQKTGS